MQKEYKPLAQSLAAYALTANVENIPKVRKLRLLWCLADYIACMIAASDLKEAKTAYILGHKGAVTLPGLSQYSFSPEGAAIAAGSLVSLLQLHDGFGKGGNHPSSVLVPALIAANKKESLKSKI